MSQFPVVTEMVPVEDVLPHRAPMILIDEMVRIDGGIIDCVTTIRADSPFVVDGRVPAIVGLEYMAQSVGALLGLWVLLEGGRLTGGLLLGTRELELRVDSFAVGDRLDIRCCHEWGNDDIWRFGCALRREGELLMEGSLTVLRMRPELEVAS